MTVSVSAGPVGGQEFDLWLPRGRCSEVITTEVIRHYGENRSSPEQKTSWSPKVAALVPISLQLSRLLLSLGFIYANTQRLQAEMIAWNSSPLRREAERKNLCFGFCLFEPP